MRVLAAATPVNLTSELDRLREVWSGPRREPPRFEYVPRPPPEGLTAALGRIGDELEQAGPLGRLYAARARELIDEAMLCALAGDPGFHAAARRRYAPRDEFDAAADALAVAWLREDVPTDEAPSDLVRSDDASDPRSLLARMRREVARHRLDLRALPLREMAALAATGDGVILIAAERMLAIRDIERTVLHEIEGHALPRQRALGARLGIFATGTARGSDDQEGRALAIERRAGFLVGLRRRELALRHVAARSVEQRADFVDTMVLLEPHSDSLQLCLSIAARVHRGGGLAREGVYLPALLRVEAALGVDPSIGEVLASGRVAVDAVDVLRAAST